MSVGHAVATFRQLCKNNGRLFTSSPKGQASLTPTVALYSTVWPSALTWATQPLSGGALMSCLRSKRRSSEQKKVFISLIQLDHFEKRGFILFFYRFQHNQLNSNFILKIRYFLYLSIKKTHVGLAAFFKIMSLFKSYIMTEIYLQIIAINSR